MKKLYSLLLLGGLLFFGVQSVWGVEYSTMVIRGSFPGASWATGVAATKLSANLWIYDFTATENTTCQFKFAETNDNWNNSWGQTVENRKISLDTDYGTGSHDIILDITNGTSYRLALNTASNAFYVTSSTTTNTVYFYNTLGWTNVYVNILHGAYWRSETPKGSGNKEKALVGLPMTNVSGNIWKYEFKGGSAYVAFTKDQQEGYEAFYNTEAAYRWDFDNDVPMYVPCKVKNDEQNGTKYFNDGVWNEYDATSFARSKAVGGFGTICSPVNATITGGTLYTVIGRKDGILYLREKASEATTLVAGTPYFYKATSATQTIALDGATYAASPLNSNGLYGTYTKTSIANNSNYYVLSNNTILAVDAGACYVGANRAYLKMNDGASGEVPELDEVPTSAPGRPIIAIDLGTGEATEIHNIQASEESVKFYQDGKLLIQKNGVVYDMMGTIVK